jgi:predicted site-specific integrase-resolvase
MSHTNQANHPIWLRPKQVIELYGLGRSTLYNLIKQGAIKSTTTRREGEKYGTRLINRASIDALLDKNATGGTEG